MPIELASLSRTFLSLPDNRAWLPQQRGVPSERQRQHYERQCKPYWQPDQGPAEDFFRAIPVTQGAQQQGKETRCPLYL